MTRAPGPPVFVVGCGRSGTTLLRLMLNAHPELAMPGESHFIHEIARLRARGRWPARLDEAPAWERCKDFLRVHPYLSLWGLPWPVLEAALDRLPERRPARVFTAIFEAWRDQQGKSRWGDKTPPHVGYLLLLERLFPQARFVHIVRDGRDVALSFRQIRSWGPRRIAYSGHYWCWRVLSGLAAGALLGPGRYRTLLYEDLVRAPEATLRPLLDWLELPFDPAVLRYHETSAARTHHAGKPWKGHEDEPPNEALIGRWRSRLAPREIASLERQAGPLLAHLGYPLDAPPPARRQRAIAAFLEPATLQAIGARAAAWSGGERRQRRLLRLDDALGTLAFALRRYPAWARRTFRWQRTAAGMLA